MEPAFQEGMSVWLKKSCWDSHRNRYTQLSAELISWQ